MRPPRPPAPEPRAELAAPSGAYANGLRPVLGALLVGALVPAAAVVVGLVAALHVAIHRRPREVLFRQTRAGRHGVPFTILKFRTMWPDDSGRLSTSRMGAVLRRTKLDELPQLWNVLRGDMALIGPRPEMLEVEAWAEAVVPGFASRLCVRPGITGLAQVEQDSTPADPGLYREKLELNRRYLERMSLGLDLWILCRTAWRPLRPRRATPQGAAQAEIRVPSISWTRARPARPQ